MSKHLFNSVITTIVLLLVTCNAYCQTATILGRVTSPNGKALPNAKVFVKNTDRQTSTNIDGIFKIDVKQKDIIFIQEQDYITKKIEYTDNNTPNGQWDIILKPLDQVDFFYENPQDEYALFIMGLVAKNLEQNTLTKYSFDYYSKGNLQLATSRNSFLGQKRKDLDPSLDIDPSGNFVYLGEISSKVTTLNENHTTEKVIGLKEVGISKDLYFLTASDSDISLTNKIASKQFNLVSPLMPYAKTYYYFTVKSIDKDSNGNMLYEIEFTPKRDREPIMKGTMTITSDQWQVTHLYAAIDGENIGLKHIQQLVLVQNYKHDNSFNKYIKSSQNIYLKGKFLVFNFTGQFDAIYSDYQYDNSLQKSDFSNELIQYSNNFLNKTDDYWDNLRPYTLKQKEIETFNSQTIFAQEGTKATLDSIDKRSNNFTLFKFIKGYQYINSYKATSYTYRGLLSTFAFNAVQGFNVTTGLDYVKDYDDFQQIQMGTIVNYGVSENKYRVSGYASHIFNQKNYNKVTLSGGSSILQFNQDDPIKTPINSFASAWFGKNYAKYFQKSFLKLQYEQYAFNGLKLTTSLEYSSRKALSNHINTPPFVPHLTFSSNNPLDPNDTENHPFEDNKIFKLNIGFNLVFDQKIISYPNRKQYIPTSKYPILFLNLEKALNSTTSDYNYTYVSLSTKYNDNIGNIGNLYIGLSAGKYLEQNNIAFTDYKHFNGNNTFIGSSAVYNKHFNLLPYYEYSTNKSYIELHLEHDFRGFIINKIPILNKTRYSLVAGYHMLHVPDKDVYGEFSIGLNNVGFGKFRPFRIDYFRAVSADAPNKYGVVFGIKILDLLQK
ncbi:DUF5686 family protein [Myroides phaeus]|uniref:CarboxypepD_reg-like domain-containing protein n=1 Tax=Myroides phaeus TaxID=702745 RepID=A0A1G8EUK7_9FLAO|nr:DUF5686 family protein [Myroides phaeus]SDH73399.1 hypothetical protein SAMN05421818_11282 [Myroides phaeus]